MCRNRCKKAANECQMTIYNNCVFIVTLRTACVFLLCFSFAFLFSLKFFLLFDSIHDGVLCCFVLVHCRTFSACCVSQMKVSAHSRCTFFTGKQIFASRKCLRLLLCCIPMYRWRPLQRCTINYNYFSRICNGLLLLLPQLFIWFFSLFAPLFFQLNRQLAEHTTRSVSGSMFSFQTRTHTYSRKKTGLALLSHPHIKMCFFFTATLQRIKM